MRCTAAWLSDTIILMTDIIAKAVTVLEPGLVLKLVKGLMPYLAAEAALFFNFRLRMPAKM